MSEVTTTLPDQMTTSATLSAEHLREASARHAVSAVRLCSERLSI